MGVTKAVSERFGKGGIADRMIWFNGFPFLDSKEDHVFNVPVSQAMTSDPISLPASDFPVREAEHLLNDNRFQGFPIVEDRTSRTLVGYIGRTELRYAIDRARSAGLVSPHAKCVFTREAAELASTRQASPSRAANLVPDTFDAIQTSLGASYVDFSRYVDHTPLTVHPRLPLETVMEIFKKMGPRVILVERRGRLTGLVTVKDCLKYQFKVEAEEHALTATNGGPGEFGLGQMSQGSVGHGHGHGHGRGGEEGAFEERVWKFLQWIGTKVPLVGLRRKGYYPSREAVRLSSTSTSTLEGNGSRPDSTRILDGTEDDEGVMELEERDHE